MSFYFSPFRFSSFLLATTLLMSSSARAMEGGDSSEEFGSGFKRGFLPSAKSKPSPVVVATPAMEAAPSPVPSAAKLDDSSAERKQPHNITDSAANGGAAQADLPSSKNFSGRAMGGPDELLQPGDEGYSSHVAPSALDIAPASAARAAAFDFGDAAAAAAAPAAAARAAAFENENNRQGAAALEGFSPAVLGDFERDFPVEDMRQWEASFRHFDDIFRKFQLAIQRIAPFASAPLLKAGRFKAWGASFAERVESTTDFGPLEAEIHWVKQYLGSYATIQKIACEMPDVDMLFHNRTAGDPIDRARHAVTFHEQTASCFLRKVSEYEKMLAKRKEALRSQNWPFPLRRDEFERRKRQCGPFETMCWFDFESEYNWDRGGRLRSPVSAILFLYLTDEGKFEARPPVIDPRMPVPFAQQIVRESGYIPGDRDPFAGTRLEVEKIDGESYRYPHRAVERLREQMQAEIRQKAFATEAYTLPCEYWELDGQSGEPKEKMASLERYSNMTFSMFCMPGNRQLKVWPLHSYSESPVVLSFINAILANPSTAFPVANDPQFTSQIFELSCSPANGEIDRMKPCSKAGHTEYWGGHLSMPRNKYARRTLTKSAAHIKQDILAIRERMVRSLKQRFPGAWENEEEGAAPARALAVEPGAARRDEDPYRHAERKDNGRHGEKKD